MSQLFNPKLFNQNKTEFDPETFNYGTEAERLKRRQALAQHLMATQAPEGQMVSGWYVAPSHTATGLSVLQKALGGYMNRKSDQRQKDLDENSRKALAYQLSQGQTPQQPLREVNDAPMIDGPNGEMIENVTATAQREPEMSPIAQQMDQIRRIAATGPQGQIIANQMMESLFAKPSKRYSMHSGDRGTYVLDEMSGDVSTIGGADGLPSMKPDDQRKIVEQAYKGVTTVEQLGDANARLQAAGVLPALLTSDLKAARGIGGQADQMKSENETETQYQQATQTLNEAVGALAELAPLDTTSAEGIQQSKAGLERIDEASGPWNSIIANGPWASNEAETRARVKKGIDKVVNSYLTALKMSGVGTSAFNSDNESKRLADAVGSIDWMRQRPEYIQSSIRQILADVDDKMKQLEALRNKAVPEAQRVNPDSSAATSVQQGVPGRGKTVRASDYGFGSSGASGTW